MSQQYAYITGGASGLGRAIAEMLTREGIKVFIADRNVQAAEVAAKELDAAYTFVDATDWDSQVCAFSKAVSTYGRIDYVFPIAGIGDNANVWLLDPAANPTKFEKPDLSVLDVNLNGLIYTVSLAVQQFRRQKPSRFGYKGKIIVSGSINGIYIASSLPGYTASKHGVTGFVRSYGRYLPREKITLNAVCPGVIRTNFSTDAFYTLLESNGLITPMEAAVSACQRLLYDNAESGECLEVGPSYGDIGIVKPKFAEFVDVPQSKVFEQLEKRGRPRL